MGDPSFVKGLPWDVGTANNTSYFPRQDTDACDPVADQSEFVAGNMSTALSLFVSRREEDTDMKTQWSRTATTTICIAMMDRVL